MSITDGKTAGLIRQSFYYLRHGQTDWNRDDLIQGSTDTPLNDTGRAQAAEAARYLAGADIALLCVSPLDRARETADIVNRAIGKPIEIIDALAECAFGVSEGTPRGNLFTEWENGHTPEGAEPYDAFMTRAIEAVNQALARPGPVLIVAHGGIYRAVREHAGIPRTGGVPNAVPIHHQPPTEHQPAWRVATMK